jgi:hypothetical protein
VLEPEDGDVAFELARQALGAGEVAVEGGAVVARALLLAAELVREQRVAARGVDHEARAAGAPVAVLGLDLGRGPVGIEGDGADPVPFARARALGSRMAKEQLVELGASHLPGIRHRLVPGVGELDELAMLVLGRNELDAPLRHADRLDLVAHAEAVEQGGVGRQQRLADVEARVVRLLDQQHVAAAFGKECGDGRAGGSAADHEHVAVEGLGR